MKILFVNEYAYPNVVSGAEFSMEALASALTKAGQEVIIASPQLKRGQSEFVKNDITYLKFPFFKRIKPYKTFSPIWFNNPFFWLISAFYVLKIVKKKNIDLVHVHGKFVLPGVILARLFFKKPVVVTVRDYKFLCPLSLCFIKKNSKCNLSYFLFKELPFYFSTYEKNVGILKKTQLGFRIIVSKFFQVLLFLSLKNADKIIGVSDSLKSIYKNSGITKSKLTSIYNLVEVSNDFKHIDNKTIISVGKISYGKGSDLLINAFEKVKKVMPDCKLIMVGSKSSSIEKIPENIEHIEKIDHENIGKIYQQASLFILMSRWPEPLSRAALEALNYGLPLIVSDKGGNKEIVQDGVNGLIIKLDAEILCQRIIELLKNNNQRLKMGVQSRLISKKKFDSKNIIARHLNLYNNLQSEKNS